ncbi:hypothetical protein CLV35_3730 [Motilibacter peucedani]|uniref:Uncharacterized protein n=1 Tax=Motilibacter peucedani TaxID=598650 RepID=A0A420XKD5_9ACTN|nr:hypothetical protein [Motilibacter peucedani]RKS68601.1 hypothetical protein CLV35_3730 [Motilibacter peucedani]
MTALPPALAALGDDLERAVAAQVAGTVRTRRTRRLRSRHAVAALVAGGVVSLAGTAAAVVALGPDEVATGMPAGSMAFAGVTPACTDEGRSTFRCTVAGGVRSTEVSDWTGTIEPFTDARSTIAGGCVSQDAKGVLWLCYGGQKAVDMQLIGPDYLGQHSSGPSVG